MKAFLRLVMCSVLLFALSAQAQLRSIPANALRADMSVVSDRVVKLDGKAMQLSVGAMIYNTNNMLVLTQALDARATYPVRVQINDQKEVQRVWLLSADEAAVAVPKLYPSPWWWPL